MKISNSAATNKPSIQGLSPTTIPRFYIQGKLLSILNIILLIKKNKIRFSKL